MVPFVIDPARAEVDAGPLAAFLADVANAGLVAVPVESLGGDPDILWAMAGNAEAAGLVDRWPDAEGGPSVVLSAWSVEHLGLRATSDGARWLRPGEREPARKARFAVSADEADRLDFAYANAPDPDAVEGVDAMILDELAVRAVERVPRERAETVELWEEEGRENAAWRQRAALADRKERRELERAIRHLPAAERRERLRALEDRQRADRWATIRGRMAAPSTPLVMPKLPQPLHLVGLGIQWPPAVRSDHAWRPWVPGDGPCPGCGGRPLSALAVCLICHKAGLDGKLPPVEPEMMPRQPSPDRRPAGRPRKAAAVAAARGAGPSKGAPARAPLRGGL